MIVTGKCGSYLPCLTNDGTSSRLPLNTTNKTAPARLQAPTLFPRTQNCLPAASLKSSPESSPATANRRNLASNVIIIHCIEGNNTAIQTRAAISESQDQQHSESAPAVQRALTQPANRPPIRAEQRAGLHHRKAILSCTNPIESTLPRARDRPPSRAAAALAVMGLFSRKDKSRRGDASLPTSQSTNSFTSSTSRSVVNRVSAGSITPGSPLSPMSPVKLPKMDLPRPPDPQLDPAGYLRSLGAVRERTKLVFDKLMANRLQHFDVDMTKFSDVVTFVSGLIKVCMPTPPAVEPSSFAQLETFFFRH